MNPDKIRMRASLHDVEPFADNWGVRTRTLGTRGTNHSQWTCYVGTNPLRNYLTDMKILRDILSHGGDPFTTSNASGALWRLANGRSSMRLMGIEGFIQACCDLAAQTVLAFGGDSGQVPEWPEPERSALSAEPRPPLPLLP